MKAPLLILCPGQGGQHAGMFDLARTDAGAAALLDRLALDGPLFENRSAQPLIVASTLAMWQAIRNFAPEPALVAGYSIGELAAYGVAGALDATDAVALAGMRAELMDDCRAVHPGQVMLAVSGLALAQAAALIAQDGFYVAIETGEDSCIAGGLLAHAGAASARLSSAGGHVTRLPVDVASHTPYMAQAVPAFADMLRASPLRAPFTPVLSGIGAVRIERRESAVEHLSRQLGEKIVWRDCMQACAEAGITVALELGPGAALSRMLQARHPDIACRSVADFRSLAGIRAWLERQCG
ncbi:MAG: acyltransferase domain-containing protein [Pseudomonadota bacterium]